MPLKKLRDLQSVKVNYRLNEGHFIWDRAGMEKDEKAEVDQKTGWFQVKKEKKSYISSGHYEVFLK